jgi:hypothetical protein
MVRSQRAEATLRRSMPLRFTPRAKRSFGRFLLLLPQAFD